MSSWEANIRKMEAERRKYERQAKRQQRDLERRLKEHAKLTLLEQARLEVESFENSLDVLLSIHKETSTPLDWNRLASAIPRHLPARLSHQEVKALMQHATELSRDKVSEALLLAQETDSRAHAAALAEYEEDVGNCERMRGLARRVLAGETKAYSEVLSHFSAFGEIANLGTEMRISAHTSKLIECKITVNGHDAIPAEVKSLTSSGKLATKVMPKARFHEIYQDYVCGCVLRIGREILALLPIEAVLVTASVNTVDPQTELLGDLPILSAILPRTVLETLDFDRLDPSESMVTFTHRGDVKTSRKTGTFAAIVPLTAADYAPPSAASRSFENTLTKVLEARAEIASLGKFTSPKKRTRSS